MVHVRPRSRSSHRVAYRYVTGMELDGVRRTNATWRKRGNDTQEGVRHAWKWHYLPRNQRMMWRLGVPLGVVLLGWSAWYEPTRTWLVVQALLAAGVLVFAHWFWTVIKVYENRHRWVGPLATVLAARWRIVPPSDPTTWIVVPPDCRTNADHPVEIIMPVDRVESERQEAATAKIIARKVGIPVTAMDYEIEPEGEYPKMLVRAQEVPPELVDFEMARPYLEQATDTRYFLGLGLRDEPAWIDLDLDSPHIAFSIGSGGGKSAAIRTIAAQVLRQGGRVVIFDHVKEGASHASWVYDDHGHLIPGVEFYTDTESVHEALISLEEERSRRSRAVHHAKRYKRPLPHFPRIFVVDEEMNSGTPKLLAYWQQLRKDIKAESGEDQPVVSPAMAAKGSLVNAGREQRITFGAVAQRFDAKVIGGGDVRASFMVRVLARFGPDAVRMLIPHIDPKPRSSNYPGRVVLAIENVATTVQFAFLEPDEAQEWALGGYRDVLEQGGVSDLVHDHEIEEVGAEKGESVSDPGTRTILELPPAPESRKLTINEALDKGIVTGNYDAVYKAIQRGKFPQDQGRKGTALTYFEHELAELEERRARKQVSSR
jgi:hypothetical protein